MRAAQQSRGGETERERVREGAPPKWVLLSLVGDGLSAKVMALEPRARRSRAQGAGTIQLATSTTTLAVYIYIYVYMYALTLARVHGTSHTLADRKAHRQYDLLADTLDKT